jgi:Flp pilus assembly protein TadG
MSPFVLRYRHERRHLLGEAGQSLIEFALILPILLVLILGVVDLGKALGYKNDQTNLANTAARLAVVSSGTNCVPCTSPTQRIDQYVMSTAPNEIRNGTGSITAPATMTFTFPNMTSPPNPAHPGYCTGDPVKVTVTSHYKFLNFLVGHGGLPGLGINITSSATMRMETNYSTTALTPRFTATPSATGGPACPSS